MKLQTARQDSLKTSKPVLRKDAEALQRFYQQVLRNFGYSSAKKYTVG